jgi:hypothetical protein
MNVPSNVKHDVSTSITTVLNNFCEAEIKTSIEENFIGDASTILSIDSIQIDILEKS